MTKSTVRKAREIHRILLDTYGPQKCCLEHATPFQLLVATILSAQCTDKKVNSVTASLFERWPDAHAFAECGQAELESAIHACGFYHAKATHILQASRMLCEQYGGEVPADMDQLTKLPGVGRKTANVVLGDAFHVPGLPVDTHVKRLANLMGLVKSDDAEKIEESLCSMLPDELWAEFSHLLIVHGRTRCPANRPQCANCEVCGCCAYGLQSQKKAKKMNSVEKKDLKRCTA